MRISQETSTGGVGAHLVLICGCYLLYRCTEGVNVVLLDIKQMTDVTKVTPEYLGPYPFIVNFILLRLTMSTKYWAVASGIYRVVAV